jgi:hypothetical protein
MPGKTTPTHRKVESHDGLGVALHIRRGHYAYYGEKYNRGKLFGKYEGMFWKPQTTAGDSASGEAKHDYVVKNQKGVSICRELPM